MNKNILAGFQYFESGIKDLYKSARVKDAHVKRGEKLPIWGVRIPLLCCRGKLGVSWGVTCSRIWGRDRGLCGGGSE